MAIRPTAASSSVDDIIGPLERAHVLYRNRTEEKCAEISARIRRLEPSTVPELTRESASAPLAAAQKVHSYATRSFLSFLTTTELTEARRVHKLWKEEISTNHIEDTIKRINPDLYVSLVQRERDGVPVDWLVELKGVIQARKIIQITSRIPGEMEATEAEQDQLSQTISSILTLEFYVGYFALFVIAGPPPGDQDLRFNGF